MDHERLSSEVMSALEACRPGRQDEVLPEVANRVAQAPPAQVARMRRSLERVDRAIMAAMEQVPVPAGLAERLLERLAAAEQGSHELIAHEETGSVLTCAEPAAGRAPPWAKHWPLLAGGALALAASLLIAVAVWPRESLQLADMQTQIRAFYATDGHSAAANSARSATGSAPTGLGGVSPESVVGRHAIELFARGGIAYELAHRRTRGTLYVVPLKAWRGPTLTGLTAIPTAHSTSGTTVVAWTDNDNAYFLVAKGDSRAVWAFFPRNAVS